MADALTLEKVGVRLGARTVIAEASFALGVGQVLALVGPNGAGKSTLLRAIAGLVPHEGRVSIEGRAVTARERVGSLAYVPQQSRLQSPLTVRDVVRLGRFQHQTRLLGTTAEDERAVTEALVSTRTEGLADRPFTAISLGEQRRVLVGRALATEARILLLDEPDAFLDVGQVVAVERLLRALAASGRTVITVLHSLDLARRVADVCALLDDGVIRAFGAPEAVIHDDHVHPAYEVRLRENAALGYFIDGDQG